MNADEAQKCLVIAKRAINERNWEKAEKFLVKSIKLQETSEAQSLLQRLDLIRQAAAEQDRKAASQHTQSQSSTRSNTPPKKKRVVEEKPAPKPHTAEEAQICREILSYNCYYKVLGVPSGANEKELKKAYKKRALRLHPDKNNAPAAEEAFKRVNDAAMCLNDQSNRRLYDQLGSIATYTKREQASGGGGGGGQRYQRRGFHGNFEEEFVNAEDFFQYMFFGQPPPRRQPQYRHQQHHGQQQQQRRRQQQGQGEGEAVLRQFGPLIFIVLITFLTQMLSMGGSIGGASYQYSLQQNFQFREQLVSHRINQIYYVSPYTIRDFRQDQRLKFELDIKVEEDTLRKLEAQCNGAKQKRQAYLNYSKKVATDKVKYELYVRKAELVDMSFCNTLKQDRKTLEEYLHRNRQP